MSQQLRRIAPLALGAVLTAVWLSVAVASQTDAWTQAMLAFEKQDREAPPPAGGVVFVGSSSTAG